MSFINHSKRHLLVTSVFCVCDFAPYPHGFRGDAYGLTVEILDDEPNDPIPRQTRYVLWRYDNAPALPTDAELGPFVAHLAEILEYGNAVIVAVIPPGQPLLTAPALLVGHDGALWLGTAGALIGNPDPYWVRPFNERVLAQRVAGERTEHSGFGTLTHVG